MLINKDLDTPLYIQLYENIKTKIENEDYKEGEKLPSIRSLAKKTRSKQYYNCKCL